jgi:hypothetical protein
MVSYFRSHSTIHSGLFCFPSDLNSFVELAALKIEQIGNHSGDDHIITIEWNLSSAAPLSETPPSPVILNVPRSAGTSSMIASKPSAESMTLEELVHGFDLTDDLSPGMFCK